MIRKHSGPPPGASGTGHKVGGRPIGGWEATGAPSVADPGDGHQLDLLDHAAAIEHAHALGEDGKDRAEQGAGEWDVAVIDQAIDALARTGRPFSAARKRGEIRPIGYTPSTDPGTHGHPVRMWKGAAPSPNTRNN